MERSSRVIATDAWRRAFPGAVIGVLVMRGVRNTERSAALDEQKEGLEASLRASADGPGPGDPDRNRILRAYVDYYRARRQTYHVKGQWESVALRGKSIPRRATLVEAMFMAELKNLILTAGHDLDAIVPPLRVDVTTEGAQYVQLNGKEAVLQPGDMMMLDGEGIISSVLRGPDQRTCITAGTSAVLFASYAPEGVGEGAVIRHLEDIRANVELLAPDAKLEELASFSAPIA